MYTQSNIYTFESPSLNSKARKQPAVKTKPSLSFLFDTHATNRQHDELQQMQMFLTRVVHKPGCGYVFSGFTGRMSRESFCLFPQWITLLTPFCSSNNSFGTCAEWGSPCATCLIMPTWLSCSPTNVSYRNMACFRNLTWTHARYLNGFLCAELPCGFSASHIMDVKFLLVLQFLWRM